MGRREWVSQLAVPCAMTSIPDAREPTRDTLGSDNPKDVLPCPSDTQVVLLLGTTSKGQLKKATMLRSHSSLV